MGETFLGRVVSLVPRAVATAAEARRRLSRDVQRPSPGGRQPIGRAGPTRTSDRRIVGRAGPQDCPPRTRLDCETGNDLSDLPALLQTIGETMRHVG